MKHAYETPKAKMVRFIYSERVIASSGDSSVVGNYGAKIGWTRCQMGSLTCRAYYYSADWDCTDINPPADPGYDGGLG